jgi:flagellar motor protein MotB
LEGKGFKTARTGNTLSIRFNYGVFARGTEMTGAACQDLRRIASTLTPSGKQLRIEVEGHTDAAPVSSGRPYAGNHELGLSRAKVVAEYLSKQCGLPADILKVTSAGEANPPFPNTTAESRKLNRTVVLKLTKVNE